MRGSRIVDDEEVVARGGLAEEDVERVARRAEGRGGGLAVEEDEDVEGGGAEEGGAEDGEDEGQGVHGRRLGVLDIARVSIVLLSLLTRRRGGAARGSGERG